MLENNEFNRNEALVVYSFRCLNSLVTLLNLYIHAGCQEQVTTKNKRLYTRGSVLLILQVREVCGWLLP